jgi:polyisoprenyl-phosphate glycosyltransferase
MLSVVIPVYNEESVIEETVRAIHEILAELNLEHEVVIVDDGSSDGTYETIRRIALGDGRIRGIRFSRNFGKEAAILAGLRGTKGDAVITIDADMQHPPRLITEMVEKWRGGAKVVHAVKRIRSSDSVIYRFCARIFNKFLTLLGGIDVRNSSDFKLLDRVAVNVITSRLRERGRFYRGLVDWIGFEQATVVFDVDARRAGVGKWSFHSMMDLGITAITSFTGTPLRIVTILGFMTLVFALLSTSETLWSWYHGKAVSGFATLEITILLVGSFVMISLGIVGEYISKIYEETKARPPYLVSSSFGFDEAKESKEPGQGYTPPLSCYDKNDPF